MKNGILITTLLCMVSFLSLAQIPNQISFQGVLTDPVTGANVPDGTYEFTFSLYDDLSAGTAQWLETHAAVPVKNGIYSVLLGSEGTPLNIPFNKPYFLEVIVGTEVLAPRIPFSSSPYSLGASSVNGLDNVVPRSGNVGIGTAAPSEKLEVVGNVKIPATNEYKYAAAKTKYLAVGHSAFNLAATNQNVTAHRSITSGDPYLLRTQGGAITNPAYFSAPVNLPQDATVTEVTAHFYDADGTYDCQIRLVRQIIFSSSNSDMASISTSTSSGQITLNTNLITFPVIDNINYAYMLVFQTTEANSLLGLYNVRITYTVNSVD